MLMHSHNIGDQLASALSMRRYLQAATANAQPSEYEVHFALSDHLSQLAADGRWPHTHRLADVVQVSAYALEQTAVCRMDD